MRIVDENDLNKSRDEIVSKAYKVCCDAMFPVDMDDVYNHLYGSSDLVAKFLVNDNSEIVGFGVLQNYNLELDKLTCTLAYLQGMVIASRYQGKGYSKDLLRNLYECFQSDLYGLRTQNIKMALSMLNLFKDTLISMPNKKYRNFDRLLELVRQVPVYMDMDDKGIIRNCYPNQLYPNLDELKKISSDIDLFETDALAVIVQPKKTNSKVLIR